MKEKFIAIAPKGAEFYYRRSSMIAVPKSSANAIRNRLNEIGYHLRNGEVWHVYDNDFYTNDYIDTEIKANSKRLLLHKYRG